MFSKFEFLVVLALAASISGAFISRDSDSDIESIDASAACPSSIECKYGALLPIPDDCTKYCHCTSDAGGLLKKCNSNLHFNARQSVCDWPNSARCEVTTTTRRTTTRRTTTKRPTTTATTTTTTRKPWTWPTWPTWPTRPTRTTTTTTTTTTEPPPTDEPTDEPTETPTEEPTEAPTEAPEEPDFDCSSLSCGYYPVRNSVRDYVHCSEGQGVVHSCPNDLEFNPEVSTCDYPAASNEEF